MADSAWSIRFFQGNNYKDDGTIDFVSNFKKGKSRQLDTIVTYSGMYGIDNYLIWNIHKDLPNYDFSTTVLNLNLYLYKNTDIVYFQDFYRVQDIKFNPSKSQYTLFAISEASVKLHTKLINHGVTSLSYKENRKASDIIRDVIEGNNIFYVVYWEDEEITKDMIDYEYRYFDIDPEWTVLDFIEYICNDNMYEWTLDKQIDEDNVPIEILHFGHEIKCLSYRNATKDYEIEKDNISHSIYSMKITTDGSPMEPLAHWKEKYRCIWSRHAAGKSGGISRGCFVPIGMGHFDKYLYLRTLEGNIEKDIGYSMLTKKHKKFPSITMGNILKDESVKTDEFGNTVEMLPYVDVVSLQKNPKTYSIREPHNIIINRGDDIAIQHQLEKITRSTPYLENEAGLLFPSPKLIGDEGNEISPPNSLVFNIDGKRESAVVGGYVYGDGRFDNIGERMLKIPFKRREDFRLKFPDKSELFYDSLEGFWALESPHGFVFKNSAVTKYDQTPANRRVEGDNTVMVLKDDMFWIEGPTNLFQLEPYGCFHVIPTTDELGNLGEGRYQIHAWNDLGEIDLYADNKINVKISEVNGVIDIEIGPDGTYEGVININTGGTVNIGMNATTVNMGTSITNVNLAGGAKALAHAQHIHTIPPGPAIPGPPVATSACTDNTTRTKAD